uniref:uncharacterized protein LOC120345255 n=1 Tax=Styela clava TaxID=7725 RepID=UPI001939CD9B|nr:uncharacterized protein LOC120345255 [Styela clava]XP_039270582.1 uncharacterized protein LOC120345255 [Styela clava]
MKLQLVLSFLAMATLREIAGYKVCGDNSYKPETAKAIAEVIDRLMAMRNTDWNWKYIHSPMLIQLNGPDKFYEKEKTVDAIRIKLETEADKMSLEDLALHTVTVKGLCKNNTDFFGMDLTEMLKQRMKQQFGYKVKVPKEGIAAFSIAMSILCISDVPVGRYFINKWLANQNEDGSFGEGRNKIETTIFTLHPSNCLSKDQYQKSMARRLRRVEEKIRNFLISHIKSNYKNGTFTGKPLTGLLAVTTMAQTPSPGEDTETWKCRELMSTIGVTPTHVRV